MGRKLSEGEAGAALAAKAGTERFPRACLKGAGRRRAAGTPVRKRRGRQQPRQELRGRRQLCILLPPAGLVTMAAPRRATIPHLCLLELRLLASVSLPG